MGLPCWTSRPDVGGPSDRSVRSCRLSVFSVLVPVCICLEDPMSTPPRPISQYVPSSHVRTEGRKSSQTQSRLSCQASSPPRKLYGTFSLLSSLTSKRPFSSCRTTVIKGHSLSSTELCLPLTTRSPVDQEDLRELRTDIEFGLFGLVKVQLPLLTQTIYKHRHRRFLPKNAKSKEA